MSLTREPTRALQEEKQLSKKKDSRLLSLTRLSENKDDKTVLFTTTVHKLGQIDPLSQTFFAEIGVHIYWFEPDLVEQHPKEGIAYLNLDGADKDKCLVPTFIYDNSVELKHVNSVPPELRAEFPPGVVHWEERVYGTFSEMFELQKFPYDVQSLTMTYRVNSKADAERGRRVGDLMQHAESAHACAVMIKPDVFMAEWRLYQPRSSVSGVPGKETAYNVNLVVRRRHSYYTLNVMVMMGCVCSLGLSVYVVPIADFSDRASILLTLMLTAVAFKFLVSGELPKVPYSTFLDVYINLCFGFLMLMMIENAILIRPKLAEIAAAEAAELAAHDDDAGSGRQLFLSRAGRHHTGSGAPPVSWIDVSSAVVFFTGWALANAYAALSAFVFVRRAKELLGDEVNEQTNDDEGDHGVPAQRLPMFMGVSEVLRELFRFRGGAAAGGDAAYGELGA